MVFLGPIKKETFIREISGSYKIYRAQLLPALKLKGAPLKDHPLAVGHADEETLGIFR